VPGEEVAADGGRELDERFFGKGGDGWGIEEEGEELFWETRIWELLTSV
jgi:hypothetical protein